MKRAASPASSALPAERGSPLSIEFELGLSAGALLILSALPIQYATWSLCAVPLLFWSAARRGVRTRALLKRWLYAAPFMVAVAALAWFQPHGATRFWGLLAKSSVSLLLVQRLASTTKFPELLAVLRRAHLPEVLCTTMALLYRYSFLLGAEAKRMQRARASRSLRLSRWALWRALGTSLGLLFVRTVARGERVHAAMRARGGA